MSIRFGDPLELGFGLFSIDVPKGVQVSETLSVARENYAISQPEMFIFANGDAISFYHVGLGDKSLNMYKKYFPQVIGSSDAPIIEQTTSDGVSIRWQQMAGSNGRFGWLEASTEKFCYNVGVLSNNPAVDDQMIWNILHSIRIDKQMESDRYACVQSISEDGWVTAADKSVKMKLPEGWKEGGPERTAAETVYAMQSEDGSCELYLKTVVFYPSAATEEYFNGMYVKKDNVLGGALDQKKKIANGRMGDGFLMFTSEEVSDGYVILHIVYTYHGYIYDGGISWPESQDAAMRPTAMEILKSLSPA